jgi:transcriptional regulator with XRE-family HTH domain
VIAIRQDSPMDEQRIGNGLRAIRLRLGLTQDEVAIVAGVSRSMVGRVERGRWAGIRLDAVRAIATALDATVDLRLRWHGGDLGRTVNARHAALHEALATRFATLAGWVLEPEVSFSEYGERGVIDALAWHPATQSLLVIELKSEFVDINELMGSVDRKRRLASKIARDRGWVARNVSTWGAVADGRTNRRDLARHRVVLRMKFPVDGHAIAAWLRRPAGTLDALGFLTVERLTSTGVRASGARRVRHGRPAPPEPRTLPGDPSIEQEPRRHLSVNG